jgi:transcriptional regulator with XRE-family HTH domain
MKLCDLLQKARHEARYTLQEAADGVGISLSYYHAIERGDKPRPKMEVIYNLSKFYGLSYDDVCVSAYRIPSDVFRMVATNKELIQKIRNLEV